jgi:LysM repeat protein
LLIAARSGLARRQQRDNRCSERNVCKAAARERHLGEYSLDHASGPELQPAALLPERAAIPFPNHARAADEPELLQSQRRRREQRENERTAPARRVRRRRQSVPWLQRNALSVVAVSVLIAFLGLGFGLAQMLNRAESAAATLALAPIETPAPAGAAATASDPTTLNAASLGPSLQVGALTESASVPAGQGPRHIQTSSKVLEPNYTVAAGDTLVRIAQRFNTTVERIQAFNNLPDPRALRIGSKLVIPPPLG